MNYKQHKYLSIKEVLNIPMNSISLLIPVYNHEKFIPELFESIWKQNYKSIQIIAVDDGSTDNSYEALLKCKARSPFETIILRKSNGGICSALNLALESATGDLIAVLASDDLLLPNRFSEQISLFIRSPELKVLYNNGRYYLNEKQCGKVHAYSSRYLLKGVKSLHHYVTNEVPALFIQSMLIKRSFLHEIGAFDEETNSDDWALNIRIFRSLKNPREFAFDDVDVFLYRTHEAQFHRGPVQMNEVIQKVIIKYLTPYQLAKFKLKFEITTCLRATFKFDLDGSLIALRAIHNLACEIKLTRLEIFKEFISALYKSALLKKYKIFSSKPV
jgi:glycosyltransferase involved in cell wall biosynthesis